MTVAEFARLHASRYSLENITLKGKGHVARVRVDRRNALMRLLPTQKLVQRHDFGDYSAHHITAASIQAEYEATLLAAGIDPETGKIVSRRAWYAARGTIRLTGEPLDGEFIARFAPRTCRIINRRKTRFTNELKAEVAQAEELGQRERAANLQ